MGCCRGETVVLAEFSVARLFFGNKLGRHFEIFPLAKFGKGAWSQHVNVIFEAFFYFLEVFVRGDFGEQSL